MGKEYLEDASLIFLIISNRERVRVLPPALFGAIPLG